MKIVFNFIIFIFSLLVSSQEIYVIDEVTMEPISGVLLYQELNGEVKNGTMSDINGAVSLSAFENAKFITISHISYLNRTLEFSNITGNILLQPDLNNLDEIVISASKFSQNLKEISQRVIFISSEDVVLSNPQTSADLLSSSGNVYIQKSQLGGGSPMIRGFSTNRLTLSVDGVRLNNAIFRGGNIHNVISIDPFNIQNTEIVLGSSSVIYGSDAIGGAMNFQTKKPVFSETDSIFFKLNSTSRNSSANKEKTAHIDFNLGFENFASLTSFSFSDFDDLKMGANGPSDYLRPEYVQQVDGQDVIFSNSDSRVQKHTGYSQFNFMQKFLLKTEKIEYDLGIHYSSTSNIPRYDRLIRYNNDTNELHYGKWYYGPQKWLLINSRITKESFKSPIYDKLILTTAYQKFDESRFSRKINSSDLKQFKEQVNIFSLNLDFEKSYNKKSYFSYGIEYLNNKVNSTASLNNIVNGSFSSIATRYPDDSKWESLAGYLTYKYKSSKDLIFHYGLRYSHIIINADLSSNNSFHNFPFSDANLNAGALTGAFGLSWIQSDTFQWKFNVTTAFRAPNIDDIGKIFDSAPGLVVIPNPDLKPEKSFGVELGSFVSVNPKINFDFAVYYTHLYNSMIRSPFSMSVDSDDPSGSSIINQIIYHGELSDIYAIQNTSKSWLYGFETGLKVNLFDNFDFKTQYNYLKGEQRDMDGAANLPVRHVSPHFGNIHFIYSKNKTKVDLFYNYNSKLSFSQLSNSERDKPYLYATDKNGNPYSPSWYTLNLRTLYELDKNFQFTASIENISNKLYRPYSSGISAPGINFIFSVNYSL
jgi:hemoglobin/transferrin/lactoferrin receptor protein